MAELPSSAIRAASRPGLPGPGPGVLRGRAEDAALGPEPPRAAGRLSPRRRPSPSVRDRDQVERGFRRLSIDHRAVLVLRHYLDLSPDEIAESSASRPGTIRSRLFYAMKALRAALEADERPIRREARPMTGEQTPIARSGRVSRTTSTSSRIASSTRSSPSLPVTRQEAAAPRLALPIRTDPCSPPWRPCSWPPWPSAGVPGSARRRGCASNPSASGAGIAGAQSHHPRRPPQPHACRPAHRRSGLRNGAAGLPDDRRPLLQSTPCPTRRARRCRRTWSAAMYNSNPLRDPGTAGARPDAPRRRRPALRGPVRRHRARASRSCGRPNYPKHVRTRPSGEPRASSTATSPSGSRSSPSTRSARARRRPTRSRTTAGRSRASTSLACSFRGFIRH